MGMQPPAGLGKVMYSLGRHWPMTDEEYLFKIGLAWMALGRDMGTAVNKSETPAAGVWAEQKGDGVTAFRQAWNAGDSPQGNLRDGTTGAGVIGLGLMVLAAIVLILKINFIVQLIQLVIQLQIAIAAAPATMGASTARMPIIMEITGRLLDLCVTIAMNGVIGG
ncbi:hypothetical protein ACIBHY_23840 [Nonomuraea sp. NPDC050547]|uniref:WXG100-like domain-containing protein n=1 Tax=unclassified Nonomuraea TaxID=2593643 RepID=UPI0037B2D8C4